MTRIVTSDSLVQLPKVSTADAVALGTALATQADAAGSLPGAIQRNYQRMITARDALSNASKQRLQAEALTSGSVAKQADQVLDNIWSAIKDLCTAYLKLPRTTATQPFIAAAEALNTRLFPDGLSFLLLKYRSEWFESKKRIELIDQEGLDAHFITLGGAVILDSLRSAQQAYGDALGLTTPVDNDATVVRDALRAFQSELRRYVISVVAHIDPEDATTQALADSLLAPLVEWKSSATQSKDAEADEPSDAETAEPEPAGESSDGSDSEAAEPEPADAPEPEPA